MFPYLFVVFIQETILLIIGYVDDSIRNYVVYNIYQPVTVLVFAFIYYRLPFMSPVKRLIGVITIIYMLTILVNYIFFESILQPSRYLPLVRGFIITFFGLLFLSRYFYFDNAEEEKFWRPLLWVTIGIAIFYPVISISITFQKYLAEGSYTFYGFKLYHLIPRVMSIFMYSCFSYAFYLCQKKS